MRRARIWIASAVGLMVCVAARIARALSGLETVRQLWWLGLETRPQQGTIGEWRVPDKRARSAGGSLAGPSRAAHQRPPRRMSATHHALPATRDRDPPLADSRMTVRQAGRDAVSTARLTAVYSLLATLTIFARPRRACGTLAVRPVTGRALISR
jgi:hypothetical protein